MLANVRSAFDGNEADNDEYYGNNDHVPADVTSDAHTLALMLQDQLEAINQEIG